MASQPEPPPSHRQSGEAAQLSAPAGRHSRPKSQSTAVPALVDLQAPQSDFQQMNQILQAFARPVEFCRGELNELQQRQVRRLVQVAYLFLNDFNFQLRFMFVLRHFSSLKRDLSRMDLLIPAFVSFKIHKDKRIFFETFLEIIYYQSDMPTSVKVIKQGNVFRTVLSVARSRNWDLPSLLKCNAILVRVFDPSADLDVKDQKWLIESIFTNLYWSIKPEKAKNGLGLSSEEIIHFIGILSKKAEFQTIIFQKIHHLLTTFPAFALDSLNIAENILGNAAISGRFPAEVGEIFGFVAAALLNKYSAIEIKLTCINILSRHVGLVTSIVADDDFMNQLFIVLKGDPDRKLLIPAARVLMVRICQNRVESASSDGDKSISAKIKTPSGGDQSVSLSIGENRFLILGRSPDSATAVIKSVGFDEIRMVAFAAKSHVFRMRFGRAESDEEDAAGDLKLRVELKDESLCLFFESEKSVLRKLNPFVELLMRNRELNG